MMPVTASRRIWWVAGCLGALALFALMLTQLYPPALRTISFMLGRPYFENCSTEIKAEGPLADGKYRITEHVCGPDERTMYVVFLLRADDWLAVPLLHSVEFPIPAEVRQRTAQTYEIILAAALTDGVDRLPVRLDTAGFPERYYGFRNGREED
jgi:hypothetical protein